MNNFMKKLIYFSFILANGILMGQLNAQKVDSLDKKDIDSLQIVKMELKRPLKILHAEPLYIDLIRDLGARKGEKEWNIGLGIQDNIEFDTYQALVEYEWAPINRLGLEVELPFTMNAFSTRTAPTTSRLNSLKLAAQYTFLVSDVAKTSLAVGYLHEFELPEFREYGKTRMLQGHLFSPFFVAAKRWDTHLHTLIYTGPLIERNLVNRTSHVGYQFHFNFHYMIPGTRNFIGLEWNKIQDSQISSSVIRPQMRVSVTDHMMIGIVTGIPTKRQNERFSSFLRLIYEPPHKKSNGYSHVKS